MSNYKPFHEKVAEQFVKNLESGNSPFRAQSTDQSAVFQTPLNASTGKNYRGLNALWLAMQPYQDPRWMTMNQANKMQIKIPKGSSATMINIVKTSESFPMLDDSGKRMKDEQGKTKYHTVQLEQPIEEAHWVFNASQLALGKDLKEQTVLESGTERLNKFITAAGIEVIPHKKNEAAYDFASDQIQVAKDPKAL
jgi:antirestriction protein ArdC